MDLILNQLIGRAKLIWIIILSFIFIIYVLDPIVKQIDNWIDNHKKRK